MTSSVSIISQVVVFSSLLLLLHSLPSSSSPVGTINKVNLPSYTGPDLDMYSGYITVDETNGRALFYWLIKAEVEPDNKPLIVWYQGGPGCSGLIGLFEENGPLRIVPGSTAGTTQVTYSDLAWTRFSNMLFVEQPAFVGFSYSNTSSDIHTSDAKAAADNLAFLELFVTSAFPEFKGRDMWFTGESYGGVYVPTLTDLILQNNKGVLYQQLKGFMIGNPVFSCQNGMIAGLYYIENMNLLYWHGIASYTNYYNWTVTGCNDPQKAEGAACQWILNNTLNQVGIIYQEVKQEEEDEERRRSVEQPVNWPSLDPDNIFQDFCTGNGTLEFASTPLPGSGCPSELGSTTTQYLNRADVQTALGVLMAGQVKWSSCAGLDYSSSGASMVPLYERFFINKPGFAILVYSGDLDILTVPFAYTQPCIAQLSGSLLVPWQPWFVNGVTAGYVETYDKYTYATVKGGGHECPLYQPLTSYQMIYRFLNQGHLKDHHLQSALSRKVVRRQSDMLKYYRIRK